MKRMILAMLLVLAMLMLFLPLSVFAGEFGSNDDSSVDDIIEAEAEEEEDTGVEPDTEIEIEIEIEDGEADGDAEAPVASVSGCVEPLDLSRKLIEIQSSIELVDLECIHGSDCINPLIINSICYTNLPSAIAAVQNGQKIEMRRNVLVTSDITVNRVISFTIETYGHQLEITASGNNPPSGELTIRGGANVTINGDIISGIIVNSGGKLNITGSVFTRSSPGNFEAIDVNGADSEITIGGSVILSSTNNGQKVAINAEDGANVIVRGSIIINAPQNESIGVRAFNSIVTVGRDITGVTRGVVAGWIPGWSTLATDVTINGAITSTQSDVLWSFPQAPVAVGVDEEDGYLTYRAVANGRDIVVRIGNAYKCVNLCDDCNECLTCSECICPADYTAVNLAIAAANAVNRSLYTAASLAILDEAVSAVVSGLNIDQQDRVDGFADAINKAIAGLVRLPTVPTEPPPPTDPIEPVDTGAAAGAAATTATTTTTATAADDEEATIPDDEIPLATVPAENADDDGNAEEITQLSDTEDTLVVIEDDDVPLAPSFINVNSRSFFPMVFTSLGILIVLTLSSILSVKIRKLEKAYKDTDTKRH